MCSMEADTRWCRGDEYVGDIERAEGALSAVCTPPNDTGNGPRTNSMEERRRTAQQQQQHTRLTLLPSASGDNGVVEVATAVCQSPASTVGGRVAVLSASAAAVDAAAGLLINSTLPAHQTYQM